MKLIILVFLTILSVSLANETNPPQMCTPEIKQQNCDAIRTIQSVCGIKVDGTSEDYANECLACKQMSIMMYKFGSCKKNQRQKIEFMTENEQIKNQKNICPEVRNKMCTKEYRPVCGYSESGQQLNTYGNKCSACSDENVHTYLENACSENLEKKLCPLVKPEICTMEFEERCGYDAQGQQLHTFSNHCVACGDLSVNVVYTTGGAC